MATRSAIGIELQGEVRAVYCHWDGYVKNGVGETLLNHYDFDKTLELISMGDLSSLGADIGSQHDFDTYNPKICTFYARDRGEFNPTKTFKDIDDFVNNFPIGGIDYYYVLAKNAQWYVKADYENGEWQTVAEALAELEEDEA
jgi:hypothetical protein